MKHDLRILIVLAVLFIAAQFIGLMVLYNSMDIQVVDGEQQIVYGDTAIGERPDVYGFDAFIFFAVAIALGTGLILFIMYIGKYIVWQLLFLYAVVMTMAISFGVFTDSIIAFALALVLGVWKVFRSNPIVHNVTEIFMYAGLAVLFVPLFDILWIVVLLLMISVYDFIAVFKSKHMIDMAKFQTKGSAFAGILVKYSPKSAATKKETKGAKKSVVKEVAEKQTNAILGGGDIVFPLLFAGVVLQSMISAGAQPFTALLKVFIIPVVVMLCVVTLLFKGERGKFYPAMPVITAGCLIGLGIVMLLP